MNKTIKASYEKYNKEGTLTSKRLVDVFYINDPESKNRGLMILILERGKESGKFQEIHIDHKDIKKLAKQM